MVLLRSALREGVPRGQLWEWLAEPRFTTGRLLRLPLRLIPKSRVVPIAMGPLKGMRWRVGSSIHGCWLGTYETVKMRVIGRWLRPGITVYDIGANAGMYTLLSSRAVGPRGRVYAFEPLGQNAMNLVSHVLLNNLDNVVVAQAALSGETGLAFFAPSGSNAMGRLADGPTAYLVPTYSMDGLTGLCGFPMPDVVKMDVEGAESRVLSGAKAVLSHRSAVWFIALHGSTQRRRCQDILMSFGYRIFTLDGGEVTGRLADIREDEIYALHDELAS